MQELKSLWKKVEKQAIYSVLFLFFILQLAAIFIPSIRNFMNAGGSLAFIAGVLLIIFRFLDERLDGKPDSFKSSKDFVQSVSTLLRQNKEYKNVDIFAQSGFLYYSAINESGVKIKNLRILLRDTDDLTTIQFPSDEKSKEGLQRQLRQTALSFELLQKSGKIAELSISYYPFDSTTYFMLLDGKSLHFGIYQLKSIYPGTDVTNSFWVNYEGQGESLIQDFNTQFEALWTKYNVLKDKQNPLQNKS